MAVQIRLLIVGAQAPYRAVLVWRSWSLVRKAWEQQRKETHCALETQALAMTMIASHRLQPRAAGAPSGPFGGLGRSRPATAVSRPGYNAGDLAHPTPLATRAFFVSNDLSQTSDQGTGAHFSASFTSAFIPSQHSRCLCYSFKRLTSLSVRELSVTPGAASPCIY